MAMQLNNDTIRIDTLTVDGHTSTTVTVTHSPNGVEYLMKLLGESLRMEVSSLVIRGRLIEVDASLLVKAGCMVQPATEREEHPTVTHSLSKAVCEGRFPAKPKAEQKGSSHEQRAAREAQQEAPTVVDTGD